MIHPPVKGTYGSQTPIFPSLCLPRFQSVHGGGGSGSVGNFSSGRIPKLNFPSFVGDNPRLWLSRCKDYFELCDTDQHKWFKIASMYVTGAAARWISSIKMQVKSCSWSEFSKLVLDRFGRDQHELLVRQFLAIRRSTLINFLNW